jgi:signal peptidase II
LNKRTYYAPLLALSLIVLALDRISKLWVEHHIQQGEAITVIPHVFRITHVLNFGAAFSLFADSNPQHVRLLLTLFSVVAILIVLFFFIRMGRTLTLSSVALALILAGAIGNLYDRIRFGFVTDFLEVHIVHYHWPDFNLADSAIVIGACLMFLELFRQPHEQHPASSA